MENRHHKKVEKKMKTETLLWIIIAELAVLLLGLYNAGQQASAALSSTSTEITAAGNVLQSII
jgi:hypothetical protein